MTPINDDTKKEIATRINDSIQKILDSPELADLSDKQIQQIAKAYYIDSLKNEFGREVKKAKLDKKGVDDLVNQWLSGFQSKHTIRSFKANLNYFLTWLNGTSLIDVDALIVDKYIAYLNSNKRLSSNTKRQRIASPSSFFSDLERWEIIFKNPFRRAKGLPKKKIAIKEAEQIPSNEELDLY